MKISKPVHFWIIAIATAIFLWELIFGYTPSTVDGDSAFRSLVWTRHGIELIKSFSYYVSFCTLILAHAVLSFPSKSVLAQDTEKYEIK